MTRLRKRDVERLLAAYDREPFEALARALRIMLDRPDPTFAQLITHAPIDTRRRERLRAGDAVALDELVAELNERRTL